MTIAAPIMAVANPIAAIAITSAGATRMPPELAPFSARLIASPRWRSNHRPRTLVIAADMHRGRSHRHDEIDRVELPERGTEREQGDGAPRQQVPISNTGRGPSRTMASLMNTTRVAVSR